MRREPQEGQGQLGRRSAGGQAEGGDEEQEGEASRRLGSAHMQRHEGSALERCAASEYGQRAVRRAGSWVKASR